MVAAATTVAFGMNAQDASVETQAIGVVIDAYALVDVVDDEIVFDFSSDDPQVEWAGSLQVPAGDPWCQLNPQTGSVGQLGGT